MTIEYIHTKIYKDCYKKHHHPMLVISAIKEGEILIQYDEKVTSLLPGSLAIFNPYENHKTESLGESQHLFFYHGRVDTRHHLWCWDIDT